MAKKYLSLDRLTEYDALLKSVIDEKIDIAKNDLLNGAGKAYDTLKELGDLIDENTTALEALESVASGKADASHNHDDVYYTETEIDEQIEILQEQLDNSAGKDVSGQTFTIVTGQDENGNDISEDVVAGTGAEVFNDYNNNKASGKYSHAEGSWTTASGNSSHSEGNGSIASGENSHAEGQSTKASSANQHVQGKYNVEDTSDTYAHIVGNGTSNSKRSNTHTIDWDGNGWFAGDVYVGSASGTNKDEGSVKLLKEGDAASVIIREW